MGPHTGVDIFSDLSPRAKPYYEVKCSQGLHFPATPFIGKQDSSSTTLEQCRSQTANRGRRELLGGFGEILSFSLSEMQFAAFSGPFGSFFSS